MPIYEFEGKRPKIGETSYVHPTSVIIGDVVIGGRCWIGPHTTLRGDLSPIRVADGSNIQDNTVIHGNTILGPFSHIGHSVTVHGATLGEHVLVGINAVVLDGARIGDWVTVAAGAVVAPRAVVPPRKLVMGVPAAIVGDVPPQREGAFDETTGYIGLVLRYKQGLRELEPGEVAAATS